MQQKKQLSADCCSLICLSWSYNNQVTPVWLLYTDKRGKTVLPFVSIMVFPTSPLGIYLSELDNWDFSVWPTDSERKFTISNWVRYPKLWIHNPQLVILYPIETFLLVVKEKNHLEIHFPKVKTVYVFPVSVLPHD